MYLAADTPIQPTTGRYRRKIPRAPSRAARLSGDPAQRGECCQLQTLCQCPAKNSNHSRSPCINGNSVGQCCQEQDAEVDLDTQAVLVQAGYTTVRIFANMTDTKPELLASLSKDCELDPTTGPDNRKKQAAVLNAWDAAKELCTKETQFKAEARVLGEHRPPSTQGRNTIRRAVQTKFGRILDKEAPSADCLAAKMDEVEQDEPRAMPRDQNVTRSLPWRTLSCSR
eukprot:3572284-Amphidinium_carterae.3